MSSYKQTMFLWRKPGMEEHEFQHYYDKDHLNLVSRFLAPPPRKHERYYPIWGDPLTSAARLHPELAGFDVFSAVVFDDASQRETWYATLMASEDTRNAITSDELQFIVRDRRILFVVEEIDHQGPSELPGVESIRVIRLIRRASSVSVLEFREQYERQINKALQGLPEGSLRYRRNYLLLDHPWNSFGSAVVATDPIDLVEEFTFQDRPSAEAIVASLDETVSRLDFVDAAAISTIRVDSSSDLPAAWRD